MGSPFVSMTFSSFPSIFRPFSRLLWLYSHDIVTYKYPTQISRFRNLYKPTRFRRQPNVRTYIGTVCSQNRRNKIRTLRKDYSITKRNNIVFTCALLKYILFSNFLFQYNNIFVMKKKHNNDYNTHRINNPNG